MDTIFKIILSIALIGHLIVAAIFSYAFINQGKTNAVNEVKHQCAMSVRYEVTTDDTTISYPPEDLYQKCLLDRGIK